MLGHLPLIKTERLYEEATGVWLAFSVNGSCPMCRQADCFYSLFLAAFEVEEVAREGLAS